MSIAVPIAKTIIKKQCRACDRCRRLKKKCDGKSPCERCRGTAKTICTYSPQKRRSLSSKLSNPASNAILKGSPQGDTSISDLAISRKYLEFYFFRVNPAHMVPGFDISYYDAPTSKAGLLQYNAALASSIRAYGGKNAQHYKRFDQRARQLAGELIEDLSFDAAFAYYLLAFHLWGESEELACHYRDITLSICKRLRKRRSHEINTSGICITRETARLEFSLSIINNIGESDFSILNEVVDRFSDPQYSGIPVYDLLLLAKFQGKLWRHLFKDSFHPSYEENPFQPIVEPSVYQELCGHLQKFEFILKKNYSTSDQSILVIAIVHIFKSLLYYSAGKQATALVHATQAVAVLEKNSHLVVCCNPFVATVFHFIFVVAFLEKDFELATRVSGIQRELAEIMPSSRGLLERDMARLKSIASGTNGPDSVEDYSFRYESNGSAYPEFHPPPPLETQFILAPAPLPYSSPSSPVLSPSSAPSITTSEIDTSCLSPFVSIPTNWPIDFVQHAETQGFRPVSPYAPKTFKAPQHQRGNKTEEFLADIWDSSYEGT